MEPMMTSKQRSLIGLAALLSFGALIQACGSSDAGSGGTTPMAGAAGAHAGAAGMVGVSGGGAASAGAPAGGAPAGGSGAGGASAGAAGASAGAAGASAGAGGGSAGGSTGPSATFTAVKSLIGMSCGTGNCHNKASKQLDYQGTTDLHALLTTALPANTPFCNGSILAVPNDLMSSLLFNITSKAAPTCKEGNNPAKTIARMPDNCKAGTMTPCLSDTQIKVISDWIAAGAPK